LPSNHFMRIHRSYIVSLRDIEAVSGTKLEVGGVELPIGKSYKEKIGKLWE